MLLLRTEFQWILFSREYIYQRLGKTDTFSSICQLFSETSIHRLYKSKAALYPGPKIPACTAGHSSHCSSTNSQTRHTTQRNISCTNARTVVESAKKKRIEADLIGVGSQFSGICSVKARRHQ